MSAILVRRRDGSMEPVQEDKINQVIQEACEGLESVSWSDVALGCQLSWYSGISTEEIDESAILSARTLIEQHPNYAYVSARLVLKVLYQQVFGPVEARQQGLQNLYESHFADYLQQGVNAGILDERLLEFDLDKLSKAIDSSADQRFQFQGIQILKDRYLIRNREQRILELPQWMWLRISMGLALLEEKREERAIEFYNLIKDFYYVPSTPTLFSSGTVHPQLSSCFLNTVDDSIEGIFKSYTDNARLSKWAGGIGTDWTPIRATGSLIQGTNGQSQGLIPWLKIDNDVAIAVNQGGKRKGAHCAYLETWHLDIEDFLDLRKNVGDERRRTHDINTANWIPDLFMKRVKNNGPWTLFSPNETSDLHHIFGQAFEKKYEQYEQLAKDGKIKHFKTVEAVQLWRKMLSMLFETGHPWITWKDPSNVRSPQDHTGVVHSSNLCTEILLNTSAEETAVCNLGSINLAAHVTPAGGLDLAKLNATVKTAVRMLDNVIDINYYPTVESGTANQRHRPIGLGLMGFQDALWIQNLSYASLAAVEFADYSMEAISYYAILASTALAQERGKYSTFAGSKWDRGLIPLDTIALLEKERGGYLTMDRSARMDWIPVRQAIKQNGMRNSLVMAIAPTATIANIIGVTSSIEPLYKNVFVKSNLSGEFTVINEFLVADLKKLNLWDQEMIDDLKYFDGSIQEIERIPADLKQKYAAAFEIDYEWVIEAASRRQKWIDMGQSLNLYQAKPSGKKINDMYMLGWEKGLKTTYYLRSMGATRIEKSTLDITKEKYIGNIVGQREREEKAKIVAAPEPTTPATTPAPSAAPFATKEPKEDCEACQ